MLVVCDQMLYARLRMSGGSDGAGAGEEDGFLFCNGGGEVPVGRVEGGEVLNGRRWGLRGGIGRGTSFRVEAGVKVLD